MEIAKLAFMPELGSYRLFLNHTELEVIGALLGKVRLGPVDLDDEYVKAAGTLVGALDAEGSVDFGCPNVDLAATLVNADDELIGLLAGDGELTSVVLEIRAAENSAEELDLDTEFATTDELSADVFDIVFDFGPADEDIWHGVSHDEYTPNDGSFAGFAAQPTVEASDTDVDDFMRACEECAAAVQESALDALLDSLDDVVVIAADTYQERKAAIVARLLEIADTLEARSTRVRAAMQDPTAK